jgi:DNA replication factor GINS
LYDELLEAWSKEKENAKIQSLQKGFYTKLAVYVKKIREEKRMLDEKTVKGRLLRREEEEVRSMVEELVRTRYEKMMRTVAIGEVVPTIALIEEEDALYREAASQADSFQAFVTSILEGRPQNEKKMGLKEIMVVRILREIPEIVGADLTTYGPFKPEDIASLPRANAKPLIKQGAAVEVKTQ